MEDCDAYGAGEYKASVLDDAVVNLDVMRNLIVLFAKCGLANLHAACTYVVDVASLYRAIRATSIKPYATQSCMRYGAVRKVYVAGEVSLYDGADASRRLHLHVTLVGCKICGIKEIYVAEFYAIDLLLGASALDAYKMLGYGDMAYCVLDSLALARDIIQPAILREYPFTLGIEEVKVVLGKES